MIEKELLKSVRHIALSTSNEDGSPHNTPLFFIYNDEFTRLYFGSCEESLHTKNFLRRGMAFVVVFDSEKQGFGGLYLTINNGMKVSDTQMQEAMRAHNAARKRWGKEPLPLDYYDTASGQSMYVGDIIKIEAYISVRDSNNRILNEGRRQITAKELLE